MNVSDPECISLIVNVSAFRIYRECITNVSKKSHSADDTNQETLLTVITPIWVLSSTHESLISKNGRHYHSTTVTEYKKKINKFQISQTATFPSNVHKTKGANIHYWNPKTCVTWTWTQLYILTIIVVFTNKHISNSSAFSHCKVFVTDGILSSIQKINRHQCFCCWNPW